MSRKMYALVKWIGGTDDKTYTSGIPTDWIIGFKSADYMNDDHDVTESYVVEWRDTKRKPSGGWKCYDCHIVLVSDRISKLNNHLKILEGVNCSKVVQTEEKDTNNGELELASRQDLSLAKNASSNGRKHKSCHNQDDDEILPKRPRRKLLTFDSDDDVEARTLHRQGCPNSDSDSDSQLLSTKKLKNKFDKSASTDTQNEGQGQDPTLADIMAAIKQAAITIGNVQSDVNALKQQIHTIESKQKALDNVAVRRPKYDHKSATSYKSGHEPEDNDFIEGNVEIGPPGSKIFISDLQWTAAISKGTYKAMATTLVTSIFEYNVLLKSNYKGGVSKLTKFDSSASPKHEALDENIIAAIKYSVQKMYPNTYTEVGLGQAINVKLNNIRNKKRLEEEKKHKVLKAKALKEKAVQQSNPIYNDSE